MYISNLNFLKLFINIFNFYFFKLLNYLTELSFSGSFGFLSETYQVMLQLCAHPLVVNAAI